jgi:hypothetical protein
MPELKAVPRKSSPIIQLDAMCRTERAHFDLLPEPMQDIFLGSGGAPRPNFDVPRYQQLDNEKVYQKGNAFIVLGLDRPAGPATGFGAYPGATHCAAIDIVAGRKGFFAKSRAWRSGKPNLVDNDLTADAARIYLSQKTGVDQHFRLPPGKVGNSTDEDPKSAVAIKADNVRVIARENIKLVTRTDELNALGGRLTKALTRQYGIDLIACMAEEELQPMVKGENLRQLLLIILDQLSKTVSSFTTYTSQTGKFLDALAKHTHFSPFYANQTSPDLLTSQPVGIRTKIDNITKVEVGSFLTQKGFQDIKADYLEYKGAETVDEDKKGLHILSPYNSNN